MADLKISGIDGNWTYVGSLSNYTSLDLQFASIWNYNSKTYATYGTNTFEFNESTSTWSLTSSHVSMINNSVWTDGIDIYATASSKTSSGNYQVYVLDKTKTTITWKTSFTTTLLVVNDRYDHTWIAGDKTYFTEKQYPNYPTYEFDKTNLKWNSINLNSNWDDIWTDLLGHAYINLWTTEGYKYYKFNTTSKEWEPTTWNINFDSDRVFHFKGNTYTSVNNSYTNNDGKYTGYILDTKTNQWKTVTWTSSDYDFVCGFIGLKNDTPHTYKTFESNNYLYAAIFSYNHWDGRHDYEYSVNKLYRTKILTIGANVENPDFQIGEMVGTGTSWHWIYHYWQIGTPSGPSFKFNGLRWADRNGNINYCSEYKTTDTTIADSGYLYLDNNSQRIPYNSNKQIKYAHIDEDSPSGALATYYPLWTTGQIENRAVTENKTRYIIFNGNKRYIADSPTATSGTNLTYNAPGYADGSGGSLSERHWNSYSNDPYTPTRFWEVYVMNSTYLTYEYKQSSKSIPGAYNLKFMKFTIPKPSGIVSATYTNPVLYSIDYSKSGASPSHTYGKYNNFTLNTDNTLVLNFNTDLTSGEWYVKKIVIQVYESTVKNKW